MQAWQPIRVTISQGDDDIDALGVFDALTLGDSWNGWATPYFTKEEGQRIVAWVDAMLRRFPPDSIEAVRWDDAYATFVVESPDDPHEPGKPIPVEDVVESVAGEYGLNLYAIGTYRWTWEVV
jgi:hypothetical protein